MRTTTRGRQAETAVAEVLRGRGFEILDQNWRTPRCEIDIIVRKNNVVYFVEVKYRSNESQGDGLGYITYRKLQQLYFAARVWLQQNNWEGDYRLLAASVSGDFEIQKIVELD